MFAEPRENTTSMLLHSLPQKRVPEEFAEQCYSSVQCK
jgi:hypothetical protein